MEETKQRRKVSQFQRHSKTSGSTNRRYRVCKGHGEKIMSATSFGNKLSRGFLKALDFSTQVGQHSSLQKANRQRQEILKQQEIARLKSELGKNQKLLDEKIEYLKSIMYIEPIQVWDIDKKNNVCLWMIDYYYGPTYPMATLRIATEEDYSDNISCKVKTNEQDKRYVEYSGIRYFLNEDLAPRIKNKNSEKNTPESIEKLLEKCRKDLCDESKNQS